MIRNMPPSPPASPSTQIIDGVELGEKQRRSRQQKMLNPNLNLSAQAAGSWSSRPRSRNDASDLYADVLSTLNIAASAGGDAAARWPVQAAAGFLADVPDLPDLSRSPFGFPERYRLAAQVVERGVQTVRTTSAGRLFDAVAALCGFVGEQTYEGQAAMWLEAQARRADDVRPYPMPSLDWRSSLAAVARDRVAGRPVPEIALAFHLGLAAALAGACRQPGTEVVAASGGVFLNRVLSAALRDGIDRPVWLPRRVPVGDGGLALGQAAFM